MQRKRARQVSESVPNPGKKAKRLKNSKDKPEPLEHTSNISSTASPVAVSVPLTAHPIHS